MSSPLVLEGYVYASSPTKAVYHRAPVTPESQKKKKQQRYHDRGSLKKREAPPRPGTERYQRWLNQQYLLDVRDALELEELMENDEIVEFSEEGGVFSIHGKEWAQMQPFLFVTEEEQSLLLQNMRRKTRSNARLAEHLDDPLLERRTPAVPCLIDDEKMETALLEALLDECHLRHVVTLDSHIRHLCDMILSNSEDVYVDSSENWSVSLDCHLGTFSCLPSSYHRLLLHAVAKFYGLQSHSEDGPNGERVTHVEQGARLPDPPMMNVVEYLLGLLDTARGKRVRRKKKGKKKKR